MTHVQKETAVLLKEKGFDLPVRKFYGQHNNGELTTGVLYDYNLHEHMISAPTLHEAADWLRSKGVHVYVTCTANEWYFSIQKTNGVSLFNSTAPNATHDLALESGIIYALKNYVK